MKHDIIVDTYINSPVTTEIESKQKRPQRFTFPLLALLTCVLAYILCFAFIATPVHNLDGFDVHSTWSKRLLHLGRWLPYDLHLASSQYVSKQDTGYIEFVALMVGVFALYALFALLTYRWSEKYVSHRLLFGLLWIGVLGAGIASLATPGILATDVYSYASYGRLLLVHHVNPYFVPPAAYPHDPTYSSLFWTHTVTVYGPLWTLISGPLSLGNTHASYILSFRAFAFAAHILNILLVTATLRTMQRSSRVVLLGTLLYAWNPLVLSESALGAHNDVFMVTFLLLGLFLGARAERNDITRFRAYVLPLIAFTLAALVKFSALPAIPIFIFLLFRLTMKKSSIARARASLAPTIRRSVATETCIVGARLALALAPLAAAFLISAGVGLAAYAPFWAGHSLKAIVNSFTSQPSAVNAFNSLLFTFSALHSSHQLPASLSLLYNRHLWNDLNIGLILCVMLLGAIGLWRVPTTRTVALVTLATLTAFLIVTPWFFVWYVTWLVGLAAVCLPVDGQRIIRGLLAFALVFSMTALTTYYSTIIGWLLLTYHPPVTAWVVLVAAVSPGLPILTFLCVVLPGRNKHCQTACEPIHNNRQCGRV